MHSVCTVPGDLVMFRAVSFVRDTATLKRATLVRDQAYASLGEVWLQETPNSVRLSQCQRKSSGVREGTARHDPPRGLTF